MIIESNITNINAKSDFRVSLTFEDDNNQATLPSGDFLLTFYTSIFKKCAAGRKNGEYFNCEIVGDAIVVYFDKPGFAVGQVMLELMLAEDDDMFADGQFEVNIPIETPMYIVDGAGDDADMALAECCIYYNGGGGGGGGTSYVAGSGITIQGNVISASVASVSSEILTIL